MLGTLKTDIDLVLSVCNESADFILLLESPIDTIPHIEFKQRTGSACAVVRTGEFTPYANVILVSGVVF